MAATHDTNTNATSQDDGSALYRRFDSYPWAKDRDFMFGASAMRNDSTAVPSGPDVLSSASLDLMRHSRIWWFGQKYDTAIDLKAYKAWLAGHPDHRPPDEAIVEKLEKILAKVKEKERSSESLAPTAAQSPATAAGGVPTWQSAAPKADLQVKHEDPAKRNGSSPTDAPYPDKFAIIVEALAAGKAVPGIREIPNRVMRKPGVTPVGSMRAPAKPWEKVAATSDQTNAQSDGVAGFLRASLDAQFPEMDESDGYVSDAAEEDAKMREG